MEYTSVDKSIASARGFKSAEAMLEYFERNGYPGEKLETRATETEAEQHARHMEMLRQYQAEQRREHTPSLRSDVLSAELATARTKAERRDAVARFMSAQPDANEARFRQWLGNPGHGFWNEYRAASEGSGAGGGFTVPQRWSDAFIRLAKEYDGLLRQFELWESPHGESTVRPVGSSFTAASALSENTAILDGPYATYAQQSWPLAPTYGASARVSNQEVMDAFKLPNLTNDGSANLGLPRQDHVNTWGNAAGAQVRPGPENQTLEQLVMSLLAESLGRALAPVASAAVYSAINAVGANSGQNGGFITLGAATPVSFTGGPTTELAAKTIDVASTAPSMIAALDIAYLDNAAWFMTSTAWAGILKQVDANKSLRINVSAQDHTLFGYPVVLSSSCSDAVLSTVSGPVFGDLGLGMTLRVVGGPDGVYVMRSSEKYAEFLQTFYRAAMRADMATRDSRSFVGVKYAAT